MVAEVISLGFDRTTTISLVTEFDNEIRSDRESRERGKRSLNRGAIGIGFGIGLIAIGNELASTGTLIFGIIVLVAGGLFAIHYLSWAVRSRRRS